ncbi:MAG: argininosuccinate synthase [Armatimonadota bacterium]|nr:argininosuccinate synthase [Armatimonadota bacterium]
MNKNRALVIYSGGLDTTVILALLKEEGWRDIHAVTIDVGQPSEDLRQAEIRAAHLGVTQLTIDAKSEFADKYCSVAMAFNADYFGYPLSTAIARPLIAEKAAEYARVHGPFDAVVHGCTGKGNDQFRLEFGLRRHLPGVPILAPVREKNWTRSEEIEYAHEVGAPIGQSKERVWSIDENVWGRSIEGGKLEDPNHEPPEEVFQWTASNALSPDRAETVEVEFYDGIPVSLNGRAGALIDLIVEANSVAGKHGVGRVDIMEDRLIGLKVRENYECPGAVFLIAAHKALEALVCGPQERKFKAIVDQQWAELAYAGLWGDPLFDGLVAFSESIQKRVSGKVRLKLFKGSLSVVGRKSPWALYSEADASFDDTTFDQNAMTGMVQTHGMSSLLYARLKDNERKA